MSDSLERPTTITVSKRVRRKLEAVKASGESFDLLLENLLEESSYDADFFAEIERRWQQEKRVPGDQVLKKAGLV